MRETRVLVLRRGRSFWGVPREAIDRIARHPRGVAVAAGAATLVADEVIGLEEAPPARPLGALARRLWPYACHGVAVVGAVPVVVVDPADPPPALLEPEGEIPDAR